MGKVTTYTGAVVHVEVAAPFARKPSRESWRSSARALENDIKRHCDNFGSISHEIEKEETCEFCGDLWTEGDSPHNGGCCYKDAEVMLATDGGPLAVEKT